MSLSRAAQTRLQWMLFYLFNGCYAARTCRHFGISRQTFYRWLRRFDRHDLTVLEERSHRPRKVRQPTWSAQLAERVPALRKQYPCWVKDKLVILLAREKLHVSVSTVGLHTPAPVAGLPHSTGIRHPLETQHKKGKVSLIYWMSTL